MLGLHTGTISTTLKVPLVPVFKVLGFNIGIHASGRSNYKRDTLTEAL